MIFFLGSFFFHIYYEWNKRKNTKSPTEESIEEDGMNITLKTYLAQGFKQQSSVILRAAEFILSNGCSRSNYWRERNVSAYVERNVYEKKGKQILLTDPQILIQLKDWTSYISTQDYPIIHNTQPDGRCFVVITALTENPFSGESTDTIKVTDYFKPIAWRSGEAFGYGIIGECCERELTVLTEAFIDGRLELGEDPLKLVEICTVGVEGHAVNLLRTESQASGTTNELENFCNSDMSSLQKQFPAEETISIDGYNLTYEESHRYEDKYVSDEEQLMNNFDEEEFMEDLDEGAGEAMFTMSESVNGKERNENFKKSGILKDIPSTDSSPYKSASSGFGEGGAGEALSPSIEDKKLLAPFRKNNCFQKTKPPNILIYCGKKDSTRQFEVLRSVFSICLNMNNYVIYHLKHEDIFKVPWVDNAAALIISCDRLYDDIEQKFLEYYHEGGSVLSFSSTFDELFTDKDKQKNYSGVLRLVYGSQLLEPVTTICGIYTYTEELRSKMKWVELRVGGIDTEGRNIILEALHESSGGIAVLSQSNLDKDPSDMAISPDIYSILKQANPQRFIVLRELLGSLGLDNTPGSPPNLTPCVLLSTKGNMKDLLYNSLSKRLKDGVLSSGKIKLHFLTSSLDNDTVIKGDIIPVLLTVPHNIDFNFTQYQKYLNTDTLGNTVLFGEVVTSTMPIIDALTFFVPDGIGLIAIAKSQTLGKGRGGNAWISPPGCAMFSLHIKVDLNTMLGQRVSYVQHISSLAVVQAVLSLPGFKDFPLRLKWPNDIYYEDKIKVGGIIVNSSIINRLIHVNIGCGVNLSNNNPTSCINELIELYNKSSGKDLQPLTSEMFIASTVTEIESIVMLFQEKGVDAFLNLYYKHWLHSGKSVQIEGNEHDAQILGLDNHGYLLVKLADDTQTSVHPDGNSFDITKNLIIPKFEQ